MSPEFVEDCRHAFPSPAGRSIEKANDAPVFNQFYFSLSNHRFGSHFYPESSNSIMREIKDTQRAVVRIGYDGRVHKRYRGPLAKERYENETRVLKYLQDKGCSFVPQLLEERPEELYIVTTNCGHPVSRINPDKERHIFQELEKCGVRHGDPFARNITYSGHLGRFCVIDFEFATILETGEGLTQAEAEAKRPKGNERERES